MTLKFFGRRASPAPATEDLMANNLVVVLGARVVLRADECAHKSRKHGLIARSLLSHRGLVAAANGRTPLGHINRLVHRQVPQLHQIAITEYMTTLGERNQAIMIVVKGFEHALGNRVGG